MNRVTKFGYLVLSAGLAGLFIAGWQAVADARLISPVFLPAPDRTWDALIRGFENGGLISHILATAWRMTLGWLLASVVGVGFGALIGVSPAARAYLGPTLEFLRPLPASAIIPVAIAIIGLSSEMVIGIVAFGTFWPMLLSTAHGFASVEPRLLEVSRALGFNRVQVIFKIALPSAFPDILAGMRVGLTIALILTIVGEMLSGAPGLGLRILLAARGFNAPDLYAGVMLLGAIGILGSAALDVVNQKWR